MYKEQKLDIFELDFVMPAMMNGAYSGYTVQGRQPYSFMSVETSIGSGQFTVPPSNSNTVYLGFLKANSGSDVGVIVNGVTVVVGSPSLATPVFFDEIDAPGGFITTPIQFFGIRITINR